MKLDGCDFNIELGLIGLKPITEVDQKYPVSSIIYENQHHENYLATIFNELSLKSNRDVHFNDLKTEPILKPDSNIRTIDNL